MTLEPGCILSQRYRILEVISQGGMGNIYHAMDESLGVEVAVKENLFSSEDHSRQFRREATILAGLRHPNLPRVTDHFVIHGEGQYMVMDYIDGEDLRQRIQRMGKVDVEDVAWIGVSVCAALSYLHHCNPPIIHRDIKPGNIKLTSTGKIFLVDFGLAKEVLSGQGTTIGAQALTPGFAPPEQYGQGTEPRSDIYSLGATLYSAATGYIPEDGLARKMNQAHLTPLRELRNDVPIELAQVIEKAIAVDLEDRFPDADAFLDGLAPFAPQYERTHEFHSEVNPPVIHEAQQDELRSKDVTVVVESRVSDVVNPESIRVSSTDGKKTWIALGVMGLIALIGMFLLAFRPFTHVAAVQSTHTAIPLISVDQTKTPKPVTAVPGVVGVKETSIVITLSPSETPTQQLLGGGSGQIAFVSERSGQPQVWVMNSDGSQPEQITQLQDGACQPDWSPDGTRLVIVSPCKGKQEEYAGSSLFLIQKDGSGLTPLATLPGGDFDPAWSPDGSIIALTSLRGGRAQIYLYHLGDDTVTRLSPQPVYDRQPAWSRDGQYIAFSTTRMGKSQIWTMRFDGKDSKEFSLLDSPAQAFSPVWSADGKIILYGVDTKRPGLVTKVVGDRINEFPFAEAFRPLAGAKYSPDGKWLAVETWQDGNHDIQILSASNASNLTRLTNDLAAEFQPVWRP